ncbi:LuxR C-terminal-related transcriptional regulator [Amycolatopsis sp. NPDC051102]|uniref:LuxR C-terminal-related transcriptional regulator n=1 Tax=Amycolatopsis sp. NPDC051102 TaxID=3155163 RepID=UPI0034421535
MTGAERISGRSRAIEPGPPPDASGGRANRDLGADAGTGSRRRLSRLDALILEAVATGASSVRIACRLHLSRQAVDYHIKGMQRQFGAVNRTALVAKACVAGVLEVVTWPPKVPPSVIRDHRDAARPVRRRPSGRTEGDEE